jgi:hypothetical protein
MAINLQEAQPANPTVLFVCESLLFIAVNIAGFIIAFSKA